MNVMKKGLFLALALALVLSACGGGDSPGGAENQEIYAENGYGEGRMGDVIHSYFMDFSVDSAYTAGEYHGHAAPEGKQVLVVGLTVKNTSKTSLPMYGSDFQAQWTASEETDEYAWPITEGADGSMLDTVAEEQLPGEYELRVNESRSGTLVFDVPAGEKDFSISHQELFDDDTDGDLFFVYFTAEAA